MTETGSGTTEEECRVLGATDDVTGILLVREVGGRLVGVMDICKGRWMKNALTASPGISDLRESCRQKLGEALRQPGPECARVAGVRSLKLGAFANYLPALASYRELGFVEEGRLKGEVILDGQAVDEILRARWLLDPWDTLLSHRRSLPPSFERAEPWLTPRSSTVTRQCLS